MSAWRQSAERLGYTPHETDLMELARNGEETAMSDVTHDLAEALAAEEHRQGMGYGDDAGHCDECSAEALRRVQAACEHEDVHTVDLTRVCDARRTLLCTCRDCGLSWHEKGGWL